MSAFQNHKPDNLHYSCSESVLFKSSRANCRSTASKILSLASKFLTFLIFSPDRLRVRGARGPRAGRHRDGEAGRVPHLRGLLGAGARQRLQRACAHETVAEAQHQRKQEHLKIYIILAACHQVNLFYVFQPSSYY